MFLWLSLSLSLFLILSFSLSISLSLYIYIYRYIYMPPSLSLSHSIYICLREPEAFKYRLFQVHLTIKTAQDWVLLSMFKLREVEGCLSGGEVQGEGDCPTFPPF